MLKEFIEKILQLGEPATIEVGETPFAKASHDLRPVLPPIPSCVPTKTLRSLITYLSEAVDSNDFTRMNSFLHIESPTEVTLKDDVNDFGQRIERISATCGAVNGNIESASQEAFILHLQKNFVRDQELKDLLALCGNVTAEQVNTIADDGVSQTVTKKSNTSVLEKAKVKNPWKLRPYRTFREIEQPAGEFVLRITYRSDQPLFTLVDTADDAWALRATDDIRAWLDHEMSKLDTFKESKVVILA